ncbi:MAG TPA: chloride channel protein [Stellaceae bacterium]|nr:chloride channel protein [Stellaceae bacterium]
MMAGARLAPLRRAKRHFPFGERALSPVAADSPPKTAAIAAPERDEKSEAGGAGRRAETRLRDSDLFLLGLATLAGVLAGLADVAIKALIWLVRKIAFGLPPGEHLSSALGIAPWRLALMPVIGGLLVGVVSTLLRRWRPREVVDAIEANALFGGRMSLGDSIGLVIVTVLSGGFGASVGLEAAYTQMGSALASRLARLLRLRRDDVRTLVGCGAAGAIAAAFNAPLTGAFYAFELIIGSYTLQTLAPVGIAALTGVLVSRAILGSEPIFVVWHPATLAAHDYAAFFGLGLASAVLGIMVMKGVTSTEALFRSQAVPRWARPALGGLLLGVIALAFPQVLGSGHGGILVLLHSGLPLAYLAGLLLARIIGSAVSIGSGFRGGMFSASLFLGSLFGTVVAGGLARIDPHLAIDSLVYTLVGMGAVAAAIVGAPVTMIMLVLETTGDFWVTIGVMVGVVTAAFAVRHWFGYSFATWRFHLRGLKIRSPEDVGWVDELMVGPMMRRDPPVIAADLPLDELRRRFPAGSTRLVFVVDEQGRLSGIVDPLEASAPENAGENKTVASLLSTAPAPFLLPGDDLRTALDRFSHAEQEMLPVLDDPDSRRIIGYLSEAYALRRYASELERHRGARMDDAGIFSPMPGDAPGTSSHPENR